MFIMVIYALLMAAFIIYRVILPLKIPKVWKVLLSMAAVMACCKNQITHLLGGPMFFAPDLPGWFLLPAAWVQRGWNYLTKHEFGPVKPAESIKIGRSRIDLLREYNIID